MLATAEQCLHSAKSCSVPHTALPAMGWEGTQPGERTPAGQRSMSHHMMCSAMKAGEKEEEEGTFGVMVFVFPSHRYV